MDGFDCVVPPGAVVGIVGANGAGKSTLFKIIQAGARLFTPRLSLNSSILSFTTNKKHAFPSSVEP